MVIITGSAVEVGPIQAVAPPFGRLEGLDQPRPGLGHRLYGLRATTDRTSPQTHTDVTPTSGPGPTSATIAGSIIENKGNSGRHWFEKMHIYPAGSVINPDYKEDFKIEFGNILAKVDRLYEIYNASRRSTQTLNTIDLSQVNPGIVTVDVAELDTVEPTTSILDIAAQFNTDGTTGLRNGASSYIVATIRALVDGTPSFNGDGIFTFGLNAVDLPMSGSRIALNLAEYEAPVQEFMSFLTNIIESTNGNEQRISLRAQPREGMRVNYRLDGTDRQRFMAVLMDWQENPFGVPLWHEQTELSADSAISATTWQITGGDDIDFRVGALALLYTSTFVFEIATIVSVTDTLVTVDSQNTFFHAAGARVMPVRTARIVKIPQGKRYLTNLEDITVIYEWLDNITDAPDASSTDWNSNTYGTPTRILLDDCNVLNKSVLPESFDRDIAIIDGNTGLVTQSSGWDKHKHVWAKGFIAHNRTQVANLKALLRYLRGRQKAFWVPTGIEDLTITANLVASDQIMDIENIDYARYVQNRGPKNVIRVSFNNGDADEIHVIESSADHPTEATEEQLTIELPGWALNHDVSTIKRVEFLELCRMDADNFTLRFRRVGQCSLSAPIRVVFDDD